MSADYQRFRDTRVFGSLDGLRALSILGVIWFHVWYQTPYYALLLTIPVLRLGEFGVHVFFGISGFLITTLLLREEAQFGRISLPNFYARRALRIWPVYYATLAVYVGIVLATERGTDRGALFFHFLPGYLTYTYTWFAGSTMEGPIFNFAWSLATEEQFYLFWPIVLKYLHSWRASVTMATLIMLHTLALEGALDAVVSPNSMTVRILSSIAVPICLGSLLAQAFHWAPAFNIVYRVLGQKWSAFVAVIVLTAALYPLKPAWPLAWLGLTMLIGACTIREDHPLAGMLSFRPLAYFGVLSYGMYLFNSLVLKVVRGILASVGLLHPLIVFPVVVATTAAIAFLSHRYFESPFLKMKKHFSRPTNVELLRSTAGAVQTEAGSA